MNPGDLVILRSGGPIMVVESTDGDSAVWCQWWNNDTDRPDRASFVIETVVNVSRNLDAD